MLDPNSKGDLKKTHDMQKKLDLLYRKVGEHGDIMVTGCIISI